MALFVLTDGQIKIKAAISSVNKYINTRAKVRPSESIFDPLASLFMVFSGNQLTTLYV